MNKLRLGIDADNGDVISIKKDYFTPTERICAAVSQVCSENGGIELVLAGDEQNIINQFQGNLPQNVSVIGSQTSCLPRKKITKPVPGSSLNNLVTAVKEGRIQGFYTIGDTAKVGIEGLRLGRHKGVKWPVMLTPIPVYPEGFFIFGDVGAMSLNQNSKEKTYDDAMKEFARGLYCQGILMGVYAQAMGVKRPRLGLLTIGEEEHKGSGLVARTDELFREMQPRLLDFIDYQGRAEPSDAFEGELDILLSDGHTGNVILKLGEQIIKVFSKAVHDLKGDLTLVEKLYLLPTWWVNKHGKTMRNLRERLNPDKYNAAVYLGINGIVTKGHGNSKIPSIYYGIKRTIDCLKTDVSGKISKAMEDYMPE